MQALRTVCVVLLTGYAAICAASDPETSPSRSIPPVLRNQDPEADVIVRLPGPAPAPDPKVAPVAPIVSSAERTEPDIPGPLAEDPPRPLLRHLYPNSFEQDSAAFCQRLIGQWTESDARFLLGEPLRHRPAFDDRHVQNGTIFAFSDPTRRYKELELDFGGADGTLRTVFVYPLHLTWDEARRRWGARVNATDANNGRRFFSYADRRLDVLVDRFGKVISFGLY